MASWSRSQTGVSPLLTTMFLMGSAVVLAGGFYFARSIYTDGQEDIPDIGVWSDDSEDRLLIVLGDPGATWQDVQVRTDRAAMARLDGEADLLQGTSVPAGEFVSLGGPSHQVTGGDAVSVCVLGAPGPVEVTLRDDGTRTVVFQQTMHLQACDA